jgi:hypothetical protein
MDARIIKQNTKDIEKIQNDIRTIKNNHLHHIEKDMARMDKTINKMDMRLWGILILLIGSVVLGLLGGTLNG